MLHCCVRVSSINHSICDGIFSLLPMKLDREASYRDDIGRDGKREPFRIEPRDDVSQTVIARPGRTSVGSLVHVPRPAAHDPGADGARLGLAVRSGVGTDEMEIARRNHTVSAAGERGKLGRVWPAPAALRSAAGVWLPGWREVLPVAHISVAVIDRCTVASVAVIDDYTVASAVVVPCGVILISAVVWPDSSLVDVVLRGLYP